MPAFTLPPHSLPLSPQSNRHPAAAVIHNGLSTEKLSTSLLAALCKTFSPSRLRTRIYNIEFALAPLCHRAPRRRAQGGGGRKAKADVPSPVCRTMPLVCRTMPLACRTMPLVCRTMSLVCRTMLLARRTMLLVVPNNAAGVPNPCAQRWKCSRQTPPLPVRSLRGNLPTAVPLPADGRSAERRVGEGEGKGGRPLAQQPATARALSPRQLVYGRAPAV